MNIFNWLLIGAGGALGSVCRYEVQRVLHSRWPLPWPVGTAAANVAGCLLAGLLLGLLERHAPAAPGSIDWRLLTITGFCGGFTTFSSFALENTALLRNGQTGLALLYVGGSLAVGLLAAAAGYAVVR